MTVLWLISLLCQFVLFHPVETALFIIYQNTGYTSRDPIYLAYTTSRYQVVHGLHLTPLMRMIVTMVNCCQGNDAAHAFRLQEGEQVNTYLFELYYYLPSFLFTLLNSYVNNINSDSKQVHVLHNTSTYYKV